MIPVEPAQPLSHFVTMIRVPGVRSGGAEERESGGVLSNFSRSPALPFSPSFLISAAVFFGDKPFGHALRGRTNSFTKSWLTLVSCRSADALHFWTLARTKRCKRFGNFENQLYISIEALAMYRDAPKSSDASQFSNTFLPLGELAMQS